MRQGSSIGLAFARSETEIATLFANLEFADWMLETLIVGRELSVGVVAGEALEVVEFTPKSGQFDYESKYTKGLTEYVAPAEIGKVLTERIRNLATVAFEACGCRDYARIDWMIDREGEPCFLEINTLPGLKETSLFPMSAALLGYDFDELLQQLVEPAISRYRARQTSR